MFNIKRRRRWKFQNVFQPNELASILPSSMPSWLDTTNLKNNKTLTIVAAKR